MSVITILDNDFGRGKNKLRSRSYEIPERYIGEVRKDEDKTNVNEFDIRGVMDFINKKD